MPFTAHHHGTDKLTGNQGFECSRVQANPFPMTANSPSHSYYRALEGQWRGRMHFKLTDLKRYWASRMRLSERLSVLGLSLVSIGPAKLFMSTTLAFASDGDKNDVLHTTRVACMGITLYRSRERIRLSTDNRSFHLSGTQAFFPYLWRSAEWSGTGTIAEDHQSAVYNFTFMGEPLEQSTLVTPDGLQILQVTPYSRAIVLLRLQCSPLHH